MVAAKRRSGCLQFDDDDDDDDDDDIDDVDDDGVVDCNTTLILLL